MIPTIERIVDGVADPVVADGVAAALVAWGTGWMSAVGQCKEQAGPAPTSPEDVRRYVTLRPRRRGARRRRVDSGGWLARSSSTRMWDKERDCVTRRHAKQLNINNLNE